MPAEVAAVFGGYPASPRRKLIALRRLIFEVAAAHPAAGRLEETLKWGEPAYLTSETKSGTSIRLGWKQARPQACFLYFNCQTTLVETFREHLSGVLEFEGRRAIVLSSTAALPRAALSRCIADALLYHRGQR